ncbi:MAG: hypothetical protein A3G49_02800 [Candidatus Sungbacteria bacterium RIFCSPLOWO2_12_FULL_41_11]|uniref:MgtC/SapB/SrpB/YhiD N-terminal domain-containing protein n=1 Tax=Candidatus Sungbacteria bacterium RIFCSPLOWO2_12_FULL_41_11 TaxID=1802286 RepID=A0A1G2LR76_9BACT|nr:MAG: hypothetical protein A3D41_01890 [Candidatus Sungbacteria bacterium RIFCSPHIGHO2_02_FULL_41_12b]OHA14145.1 MAG: hypothetical protein A3G49_02800 [Candidatus Sungbacteria bacterium RIFCSPLOWO2_12_FULL_41_11]
MFLGAGIGMEREVHGKAAGLRTYSLVSLGACLFTIISIYGFREFAPVGFDPSRIASQVVVGIGFIGAGLIFLRANEIQGLTTAAGLWISAAVGMSVAVKMYWISIFASFLAIFVLRVLRWFEPYFHSAHKND